MPHQDYVGSDNKPWPSATELTMLLPQPWLWAWYKNSVKRSGWQGWLDNLAASNIGMEIGREVHSLIEAFIAKSPLPEISGKYESQAFADALYDKVSPLVDSWEAIEPHLKSERLKIHGTADAIVRLSDAGGLAVLDWKTGASKSNSHPIQLAIYAMCWNEDHSDQLVDKGLIARVDKKSKGLNVKIDEYLGLKQYYPVIDALRIIWEYSKSK